MKLFELVEHQSDEDIAKQIVENCGPFFRELGGFDPGEWTGYGNPRPKNSKALYRGMRPAPHLFQSYKPVMYRIPVNTPASIHNAMNSALDEKFGYKFRNGSFTFTDRTSAVSYGTACLFFPINELIYCWSPKIQDAYNWFYDEGDPDVLIRSAPAFNPENKKFSRHEVEKDDAYLELIYEYIKNGSAGYKMDSLKDVPHRTEVMFVNDYYLLNCDSNRTENIVSIIQSLL